MFEIVLGHLLIGGFVLSLQKILKPQVLQKVVDVCHSVYSQGRETKHCEQAERHELVGSTDPVDLAVDVDHDQFVPEQLYKADWDQKDIVANEDGSHEQH